MGIVTLLLVVGLVLALVRQFEAHGRDLLAWAVVFIAAALLYGRI